VLPPNQVTHGAIGWSPGGALVAVMVITLQVGPHWWLARLVETANALPVRQERR
jgi:hypothetical protein